jgi:hypothetical protein
VVKPYQADIACAVTRGVNASALGVIYGSIWSENVIGTTESVSKAALDENTILSLDFCSQMDSKNTICQIAGLQAEKWIASEAMWL